MLNWKHCSQNRRLNLTFILKECSLSGYVIRYSGHHLLVISSVKPLYNGKIVFKTIPEVISKVRYFSQMYKNS
jgi:hypothetical protein